MSWGFVFGVGACGGWGFVGGLGLEFGEMRGLARSSVSPGGEVFLFVGTQCQVGSPKKTGTTAESNKRRPVHFLSLPSGLAEG